MISIVALIGGAGGANDAASSVMFGGAAIIVLPLVYGIGGLIGGAFMAVVYNFVASAAGGIEMDLG